MKLRWLLALPALICLGMLACSSPALCQEDFAGAKAVARNEIEIYFKHPAYPWCVTASFDLENAEDLKRAVVLESFIEYWIGYYDILDIVDEEQFIEHCDLKELVVPVQVDDRVVGYVYAFRDEGSELGWKAGGGAKSQPGSAYGQVYARRAGNPENEYHLLTVILDMYHSYVLAIENGVIDLIPIGKHAARVIGSEKEEDGSYRSVPLSQALPILKQRSTEEKQWIESKRKQRDEDHE